jgi:hypothetical protein
VVKQICHVLNVWGNSFSTCVRDGKLHVFLDAGAGLTCIGKGEFECLRLHLKSIGVACKFRSKSRRVTGVGGRVYALGEALIPLGFGGKVVLLRVVVLDGQVPSLMRTR